MTSLDHLFRSWDKFKRGKRKRKDVQCFERHLEDNIFQLHLDLITFQYQHVPYDQFYVNEPKQRHISKAQVRDRLVHHAIFDILYDFFDKKFIFHSLSSRLGKGTHVGVDQLNVMIRKISQNGKLPCYALKMDIRRFFDTIDHQILKALLQKNILDEKALLLIDFIIDSFYVTAGASGNAGIPLGNVTSQLFANIYLHELDDFVKQTIREKYYLRYCDDFIILTNNALHLQDLIGLIKKFLIESLKLELHPKKVTIIKLSQGIDFIGSVLFEHHILTRNRTKQRMKTRLAEAYENYFIGKISPAAMDQKLQSYLGILSHANQHDLSIALKNNYWVREPL